jgi:thymidylate kinase
LKKDIFIRLISFLKINNIDYCILGNTNDYPSAIGSDVDIVIKSESFTKLNSIVYRFSKDSNFNVCNLLQHETEGKYFVVSIVNNINKNFEMLALDFSANYMRHARIILTDHELLESRQLVSQNGVEFWVCCNEIAFIYYLIKKIEKQSLNVEQFKYLNNLWLIDREQIIQQFHKRFHETSSDKLIDVFDKGDFNELSKEFLAKLNQECQSEYNSNFKNKVLEFKRKIYRFMKPTGVIISLLGCDGSGKSTVIDQLVSHSDDFESFRGVTYHHLFATKKESFGKPPVSNPHDQIPRSWMMSNLKLMYFFVKYFFGYWLIAYPQKVRSKLVVFDRYYYDILVDPRRYRHNGSVLLTRFIGKIIPKPDLFFVIDVPAEILQQRKQEVTFEESKRQRQAYLDLKNQLQDISIIDNTKQPGIAGFEVKKVINRYLVDRYNKRFKL